MANNKRAGWLIRWTSGSVICALLGVWSCSTSDPDVPRAGPALKADALGIFRSESFHTFIQTTTLDQKRQIEVARTLALHFRNEASIRAAAKTPEAQSQQHQQLLGDTVAHLRTQIPAESWDAFARSGLLPEVTSHQ